MLENSNGNEGDCEENSHTGSEDNVEEQNEDSESELGDVSDEEKEEDNTGTGANYSFGKDKNTNY